MEGTNAMNASPYVAISLSFLLLQPRINLAGHQLAVGNSWLWSVDGVKVLVDPIIEGPLDFGIPWLYTGYKKVLKSLSLDDVIDTDVVLITQSLDDHMHVRTLKALAARRPDVPVIATPNGQAFLDSLFSNVTYLEPGSSTSFSSSKGARLSVKAVPGPVLGPPWQRPENGYIVRGGVSGASIYIEPHCVFNEAALKEGGERVDVLVTPVVKQELPAFTLVSGQEDAVRLAQVVGARYVAPMANADVDASGILSALVTPIGTLDSFKLHSVRRLYENIVPSHTVYDVESPEHVIRRFSHDGQYLICFSRNGLELIVYRFHWFNTSSASPATALSSSSTASTGSIQHWLAGSTTVGSGQYLICFSRNGLELIVYRFHWFSHDGQYLICFSRNGLELIVYRFHWFKGQWQWQRQRRTTTYLQLQESSRATLSSCTALPLPPFPPDSYGAQGAAAVAEVEEDDDLPASRKFPSYFEQLGQWEWQRQRRTTTYQLRPGSSRATLSSCTALPLPPFPPDSYGAQGAAAVAEAEEDDHLPASRKFPSYFEQLYCASLPPSQPPPTFPPSYGAQGAVGVAEAEEDDHLPAASRKFPSYFEQLYCAPLGRGSEVLCKDLFLCCQGSALPALPWARGTAWGQREWQRQRKTTTYLQLPESFRATLTPSPPPLPPSYGAQGGSGSRRGRGGTTTCQQRPENFPSYFEQLYCAPLGRGSEVLCKDLFLCCQGSALGVFASATPADLASPPRVGAVKGVPAMESITLHLVRLCDGKVVDRRVFRDDYINLTHNGGAFLYDDLLSVLSIRFQRDTLVPEGAFLYDNLLSVLSIRFQRIHLFQIVEAAERFVDVQVIGAVRIVEAAEAVCRLEAAERFVDVQVIGPFGCDDGRAAAAVAFPRGRMREGEGGGRKGREGEGRGEGGEGARAGRGEMERRWEGDWEEWGEEVDRGGGRERAHIHGSPGGGGRGRREGGRGGAGGGGAAGGGVAAGGAGAAGGGRGGDVWMQGGVAAHSLTMSTFGSSLFSLSYGPDAWDWGNAAPRRGELRGSSKKRLAVFFGAMGAAAGGRGVGGGTGEGGERGVSGRMIGSRSQGEGRERGIGGGGLRGREAAGERGSRRRRSRQTGEGGSESGTGGGGAASYVVSDRGDLEAITRQQLGGGAGGRGSEGVGEQQGEGQLQEEGQGEKERQGEKEEQRQQEQGEGDGDGLEGGRTDGTGGGGVSAPMPGPGAARGAGRSEGPAGAGAGAAGVGGEGGVGGGGRGVGGGGMGGVGGMGGGEREGGVGSPCALAHFLYVPDPAVGPLSFAHPPGQHGRGRAASV
ncbi:unnamed protein product [Closterium sp. NIES-64]|nr:unnamed protein product [Closterium sp. NIES-64]